MDLRKRINPEQLARAKELVRKGLLGYQPFVFSEDLETGVGHEFLGGGEYSGLVYWGEKGKPPAAENPHLNRWLIDPPQRAAFSESNDRLRGLYESFVDQICEHLGDISKLTFAEIGCNTGYFPISFAKRNAKSAVGFDRGDFSVPIKLLNEVVGTNAKFVHQGYDSKTRTIPNAGIYDVVLSLAVLVHLSDPLQHLACLNSMARKAIFIFTPVSEDDKYSLTFGEPNKYYKSDPFPWCFDNTVIPSRKLLNKSLELMGFDQIHQIKWEPRGMPEHWFNVHACVLGIRSAV